MSDKTISILIGLYLVGVILTFGYASNEIQAPKGIAEAPIVGGIFVAIAWPLYLSHKAFERTKP